MADLDGNQRARGRIEYWFTVLVGPLALSVVGGVFVSYGTGSKIPNWLLVVSAGSIASWFLVYVGAYTSILSTPLAGWSRWRRKKRFQQPVVCILDGRVEHSGRPLAQYTSTNRTADDWRERLRKECPHWRIELAAVDRSLDVSVQMVINPVGETYPEEDLTLHTTFSRIREYVRSGGVFVNVAGYPFFYGWNSQKQMNVEAGRWERLPPVDGQPRIELQPLLPVLLGIEPVLPGPIQTTATRQEAGARERFGEIAGAGGNPVVQMFRQYPLTAQAQRMIPLLLTDDGQAIVIGAVPFGSGYFLLAGVEISDRSATFDKVIAAVRGWALHEARGGTGAAT